MTNRKTKLMTLILTLLLFFCATFLTAPITRASASTGLEVQINKYFSVKNQYGEKLVPSSTTAVYMSLDSVDLRGSLSSPQIYCYVTNGEYETKIDVKFNITIYEVVVNTVEEIDTLDITVKQMPKMATSLVSFRLQAKLEWGKTYRIKLTVKPDSNDGRFWETKDLQLLPVKNKITVENDGYYYQSAEEENTYYSATSFFVKWSEGNPNEQTISNATVNGDRYSHGAEIAKEGENVVKIASDFYNWEYKLIIDKTAPTIEVKNSQGKTVDNGGFFNDTLTVKVADDLPIKSIEYGDGKTTSEHEFTILRSDFIGEELKITVQDNVGNKSVWRGRFFSSSEFSNERKVANEYKITSWYNVKFPSNRYVELANENKLNYSLHTYEDALDFAMEMERQYQVEEVASGWVYAAPNNYSNKVVYESEDELNVVIKKYAELYVSSKQVFSTGKNNYYSAEPQGLSLTFNNYYTPSVVSTTIRKYYLINKDYVFTADEVRVALGTEHKIKIKYIGDVVDGTLINSNKSPNFFEISLGARTFEQHLRDNNLQEEQGFYLVQESDDAGNSSEFLVYYDLTAPTTTLIGKRGDADNNLSYNIDIATYSGEKHFVEVALGSALVVASDNQESWNSLVIKINGRGYASQLFSGGDELPTLCADNGNFGLYTVTLYDRSCNITTFEFYVAPKETPGWTHTSLSSDTQLKITFNTGYSYNTIKELTIYRIASSGTKTAIEYDSLGTKIDFTTYEYIFYVGGKYQAEIVDAFGRNVQTGILFYKKGLPGGILKGVTDGGATRRNVTFTCDENFVLKLYVIDSGTYETADATLYTKAVLDGEQTLQILASEETSHRYLLAVHNEINAELFIEYTFEIDTVCSDVVIYDVKTNEEIEKGSVTINGFYIQATEPNVTFTYYLNNSGSGFNLKRYTPGERIYTDGTYYFTAKDYLGNTREFTVYVDASVMYQITGEHTTNGKGEILAKQALTFTALEKCNEVIIHRGTVVYNNGELLFEDGTYNVYAQDQYGNVLQLIIKIDTVAPVITLDGVANGSSTRNNVSVTFSEGTGEITNSKGGHIANVESGQVFVADGDYYIKVKDEVGNETTAKFFIRTKINVQSNILNNQITTDAVEVSFDAGVNVVVKRDGETIEPLRRYTEKGRYVFTASDEIGNTTTFKFEIIEKTFKEFELVFPTGWNVVAVYKDGKTIEKPSVYNETGEYIITVTNNDSIYELTFEIDATPPTVEIKIEPNRASVGAASEKVVSTKLYKDGTEIAYRLGDAISESGTYRLEIADALGNVNVYEFEVPFALNVFAIIAIVVGVLLVIAVAIFLIKSKKVKI